jgi:hypothetical protein
MLFATSILEPIRLDPIDAAEGEETDSNRDKDNHQKRNLHRLLQVRYL